jgi:hypothetical protein
VILILQLSDRRSLERDRAIRVDGTVEKESRPMGGFIHIIRPTTAPSAP